MTLNIAVPGVLSNDSDADSDPLSAVLEDSPATGSLDFGPDGSFTYIPEANYTGVVTFHYRIMLSRSGHSNRRWPALRIDIVGQDSHPQSHQQPFVGFRHAG